MSPYVRKVLAVCELKGIPYQIDPIMPFFGGGKFDELSPLRRIPVYIDDKVSLCDSTVICEYLEERFPSPRLLPADLAERARSRWLEEFADTRIGDVFIWKLFYLAVVAPLVWQKPRDKEKIASAVAEELPDVMAHLERMAPAYDFLFGEVSTADIAIAVFFANLRWARVELASGALAEDGWLGRAHDRTGGSRRDHAHRRHVGADAAATASRRGGGARSAADGRHGRSCGAAPWTDDEPMRRFCPGSPGQAVFCAGSDCLLEQQRCRRSGRVQPCRMLARRPSFGASPSLQNGAAGGN